MLFNVFIEGVGRTMRNVSSVKEYTQRQNKKYSRKACSYQLLAVSVAWFNDFGK